MRTLLVSVFSCLFPLTAMAEAPALEKPAEPMLPMSVSGIAQSSRLRTVQHLVGTYRPSIDACAKLTRVDARGTTIDFTASSKGRASDVSVTGARATRAFERCVVLKANEWILPRGPKLRVRATFAKQTVVQALPTL